MLRGEVQKLDSGPKPEFRCTGNISHHFYIKNTDSLAPHLHLSILLSVLGTLPTGTAHCWDEAAPAGCNERIHHTALPGKGEGIAWFADTVLLISVMALEFGVCIMLPEFKSI